MQPDWNLSSSCEKSVVRNFELRSNENERKKEEVIT
jgi:hypothetical protein